MVLDDVDTTVPSNPPRLCARYFSEAVPSQTILSLFSNVPAHIVIRSSSPPSSSNGSTLEKEKKRPLPAPVAQSSSTKKQKTLAKPTARRQSKEVIGQRSMNEFFRTSNALESPVEAPESLPSQVTTDLTPQSNVSSTDTTETEILTPSISELRPTGNGTGNVNWTSIFTKKGPPVCDVHGLPCIELVTKKPGPNLGRRFWICSKPVGPGYDNGKSIFMLNATDR